MKKTVRMLCGVLLLGSLVFSLPGCSRQRAYRESEDKYIVGVVTKSSSSEYWMSVHSGMEAAAADFGMEIVFLAPDSELKQDVQEKLAEKLIERGVDALAVAPINSYDIPSYIEKLEDLGIPAVSFDTAFEGQSFPYIGIDNREIGYKLAEILAEEIAHKGEVGIVAGSLEQMGHKERVEGFLEYMETEPEITVAFTESGYANLQMSGEKVRAILEEYPRVKGIFATSAVTALGLSDATGDRDIRIVTVDEQKDALDGLESGALSALALQSGYEIGYETIRRLDEMREGREGFEDFVVDAEILTQENVAQYRREYEAEEYSE